MAESQNGAIQAISSEFYAEVLSATTELPQPQRQWSICQLILQHAIAHLDPYQRGMVIVIAQCMPPHNAHKIRSLRVSTAVGTSPWNDLPNQPGAFLGAESLSGYVTATGHSALIQDVASDMNRFPAQHVEHMAAVMVSPLKRSDRTAGCLWVASAETNTFTPSMELLILHYANLITLIFETEDFYRPQDFELCVMPLLREQVPVLAGFQKRITQVLSSAILNHQPLSYHDAERIAWQQVEEELILQLVLDPKA